MSAGQRTIGSAALGSVLSLQLCGCVVGGYNTYATPRTVPKGRIQSELAIQGVGFSGEVGKVSRRVMVPVVPNFGMRLGLARNVDSGVHFALTPLSFEAGTELELGWDLRARVLDGDTIEVAIDPRVGFATASSVRFVNAQGYFRDSNLSFSTFEAPLVTGINLTDSVSLVLTTGVLYGLRDRDEEPNSVMIRGRWFEGFAPHVGLGVHDDGGGFGLHPEASLVFATRGGEERIIYTIGLGFEWRRAKPPKR
jgi:hypothetical protein